MRNYVVYDVFNQKIQIMERPVFVESHRNIWMKKKLSNVFIVDVEDAHQEVDKQSIATTTIKYIYASYLCILSTFLFFMFTKLYKTND
jgi:hypothetical protein